MDILLIKKPTDVLTKECEKRGYNYTYLTSENIRDIHKHYDACWCFTFIPKVFESMINADVRINCNAESFITSGNKWLTYQRLEAAGFPQAKTSLTNIFGYPVIMKSTAGSLGYQVFLVHNEQEEKEALKILQGYYDWLAKNANVEAYTIYQEYIEESSGIDICVYVAKDHVIAAMKRKNHNDFRSHVFRGGVGSVYELTPAEKDMSVKIAATMNLDYCSINYLIKDGQLVVCETNANAGLDTIETITSINIPSAVFDAIEQELDHKKSLTK